MCLEGNNSILFCGVMFMMMRRFKLFKSEKGASAVEAAFILPILVTIALGIFWCGLAYNNWIALTHAAREGARLAAVGYIDKYGLDEFKNRVEDSAPSVEIDRNKIEVKYSDDNHDGIIGIGDSVRVKVPGVVLDIAIPFVEGKSVQLFGEATMRLEQHPQPSP